MAAGIHLQPGMSMKALSIQPDRSLPGLAAAETAFGLELIGVDVHEVNGIGVVEHVENLVGALYLRFFDCRRFGRSVGCATGCFIAMRLADLGEPRVVRMVDDIF